MVSLRPSRYVLHRRWVHAPPPHGLPSVATFLWQCVQTVTTHSDRCPAAPHDLLGREAFGRLFDEIGDGFRLRDVDRVAAFHLDDGRACTHFLAARATPPSAPTPFSVPYGHLSVLLENGGVREDSATPCSSIITYRSRQSVKQLHRSVHPLDLGRARGNEPARIPQRHPGQHEVLTNDEPRHQPSALQARPNQRLYVPLGSPPSVAVGSSRREPPTEAARPNIIRQAGPFGRSAIPN
jgi:hypothetical protein